MTKDGKPATRPGGKRAERMARALRANLHRRKLQLRGRSRSDDARTKAETSGREQDPSK